MGLCKERPLPSPLPQAGEGAVRSGRRILSHPETPNPHPVIPANAGAQGSRASSLLRKAKAKARLLLGFPEKPPRTPKRPFRRPSETPAQEVMRHGCRESPAGYRHVPSGRASVAGEFVRVARLRRARMRGKPFWFLFAGVAFHRLTKGTRPRGRNERYPSTPKRRKHTQTRRLWVPAFAGMRGVRIGARDQDSQAKPQPLPYEKCRFPQPEKRHPLLSEQH